MWSKPALAGLRPVTGQGKPAEIILDLSRLLSRVLHPTPTGIDRVEMAYARELARAVPDRLSFAAVHPFRRYGRLPRQAVMHFLDQTERLWNGFEKQTPFALRLNAARRLFELLPRRGVSDETGRTRVYLQASPHHLDKPELVGGILRREHARFVCLVHDLIPIQYPEYARPGGADQHKRRIDTLGMYADAMIANSAATRDVLASYLMPKGPVPPIAVAHLGTHVGSQTQTALSSDIPYFVCVSTIEPRKNHLLLLNLWRRMAEERLPDETIPKLVLIGRRGWENENVLDLLDRCPQLQGHVIEASRLPDGDVEDLIRSARAVLLPSFAEGYGMPVAESFGMGVPVICSDLPALREVGRDVPEYLDPLDGKGWLDAIKDYAADPSRRRQAQHKRMKTWSMPTWESHVQTVLNVCDDVAAHAL
jgi:glycosyltransferase involved in cell wall biosynthesis